MKPFVITFFLIPLFFSFAQAKEQTIKIGVGEWAPYLSKDLKHKGIAGRIITEIFAKEGIQVTFKFYPWKRAFEMAKFGKIDGTAVWLKKPEREKIFYYTDAVIEEKHVFFHLKKKPFEWNKISDLKNMHLGGLVGFSYGKELDTAIEMKKLLIDRTITDTQNFKKLLNGRIELYPQEVNVGLNVLQKEFSLKQRKADYLSAIGNKQFISDLMPKYPIYVPLLPEPAREVIGQVHKATLPAYNMLKLEGFQDSGYVDIFDAGPTVEAPLNQI